MFWPNTVLCVDDDPTVQAWRQLLLSIAGYDVKTTTTDSAMECFSSAPVDLVVVGSFLPYRNGAKVARQMKRLKPSVPVMILNAGPEELPSTANGADAVFRRGTTPTDFLAAITKLLPKPPSEAQELTAAGVA
ncbi:MAG TPA: response regulator [Candidatus Binatia bacterium]|nr:response regulator [Candidatus Binatia bacterium]